MTNRKIINRPNPKDIKFLVRLDFELSHLCDHKLKQSFDDPLNPVCNYGVDIGTMLHFFHLLFKHYLEILHVTC